MLWYTCFVVVFFGTQVFFCVYFCVWTDLVPFHTFLTTVGFTLLADCLTAWMEVGILILHHILPLFLISILISRFYIWIWTGICHSGPLLITSSNLQMTFWSIPGKMWNLQTSCPVSSGCVWMGQSGWFCKSFFKEVLGWSAMKDSTIWRIKCCVQHKMDTACTTESLCVFRERSSTIMHNLQR